MHEVFACIVTEGPLKMRGPSDFLTGGEFEVTPLLANVPDALYPKFSTPITYLASPLLLILVHP